MAINDEELREAASHRGLKLIKSRRRKPGTGDFGLFGLTDALGKALFGVGEEGLTATAEQIADFLRRGEASTWAKSADITPARPTAVSPGPEVQDVEDASPSAIRPRRRTAAVSTERERAQPERPSGRNVVETPRREEPPRKARPSEEPVRDQPAPELAIRAARPADADALRTLFASVGFAGAAAEIKRAITAASGRKEPVLVADRGSVVGCLAFHIIPTIQQGAIARITALLVNEGERRRGVGRALYDAALSEFREQNVQSVEAMSAIEVRNANAFYRALGLKQASYRFTAEM